MPTQTSAARGAGATSVGMLLTLFNSLLLPEIICDTSHNAHNPE
jgi:hypothetical protein